MASRARALALIGPLLLACATGRAHRDVERAQLALARALVERQDWGGALASVDRLHKQGRRSPESLTLRAVAYREQRILDDAERDLEAALELDDDYAPAHAALAVVLDLQGKHTAAEPHHRRALALDPDNAAYLNDWGFSLYARGGTPEAIVALRRATDLAPLERRYRNNLGFAYARSGDFSRAAQQFAMGGTPAEACNNLGFAYETAENWAMAYESYQQALHFDPHLPRARANLAHAATKLDRAAPSGHSTAPAPAGREGAVTEPSTLGGSAMEGKNP